MFQQVSPRVLSLFEKPPAFNTKFLPTLIWSQKSCVNHSFYIWFDNWCPNCRVWLSGGCLGQQTAKNAIFAFRCFQKFNFDYLLLKLLICSENLKHIQHCVSFVGSVINHDFRDIGIFHPIVVLKSQIMTLSQKCQKKWFIMSLPFYTTFSWYWKLEEKT